MLVGAWRLNVRALKSTDDIYTKGTKVQGVDTFPSCGSGSTCRGVFYAGSGDSYSYVWDGARLVLTDSYDPGEDSVTCGSGGTGRQVVTDRAVLRPTAYRAGRAVTYAGIGHWVAHYVDLRGACRDTNSVGRVTEAYTLTKQ